MHIKDMISVDEMIGQFLKAELHSSRFREGSLRALTTLDFDESLLERTDYDNIKHNQQRLKVFSLTRGWPDKFLFLSFPADTVWYAMTLSTNELKKVMRLKSSDSMTPSERSLENTANKVLKHKKIKNIDNTLILAISKSINNLVEQPPIIMVAEDFAGKKVLIEGHSRSVAYCISRDIKAIPAIIGISNSMSKWEFF